MARDSNDAGSQRQRTRFGGATFALWSFFVFAFCLVVHSFVHDNFPKANLPFPAFWKLELLKINDSLLLLITLFGLIITWKQVRLSMMPRLMYSCKPVKESEIGLPMEPGKVIWRCCVKNVGSGSAIIDRCSYWLSFQLPEGTTHPAYTLSYADVVSFLREKGFEPGRDYGILRYSEGAVIGSQVEQTLLEIGSEALSAVRVIDVRLEYTALLGGQFSKEIFCVPRDGIERHVIKERLSSTRS